MSLQFDVLGPIRVRGGAKIELSRPSHRRLLAILALDAGQSISTDRLIHRFWPDDPPPTAKAALQTHVSALRRILGNDAIVTDGHGYRLDFDTMSLDSDKFLRLAAESRRTVDGRDWDSALRHADAALDLWRGQPFTELLDDDFARPTIVKLEELHLELLEIRVEALLGLDRPADVLPELEGLVIEHPLRERLWEHLMTARYRLGRHPEALRAYQEVSQHLAEIGLEPGERLGRLEEQILFHDRSLTQTRNNLPVDLSSFVGRTYEIGQSSKLLAEHRLVTLTGAGGSGKTRLAIYVARSLLDSFPDGVWLVELAATHDPGLVPAEIARAMGLKPKGEDVLEFLVEATAAEKILIVLDNCEHLLEASATTTHRLLRSSPHLKILATSREPLRVPGEFVYEIRGMRYAGDDSSKPQEALEYEAVELFEQRATQVDPSFGIDDLNLRAVVTICKRLDGMPLAIELAAARTRSLTVEIIAHHLNDQLLLLTSGSSTAPPRQRTLHGTIEWSYRLLNSVEKTILNRLSVFRGGFQLDAAEHVVSGAGIAPREAIPIVADLVDKSLVARYETRLGTRYRLLEPIRQYASRRLEETADTTTIHDQHQQWYLSRIDNLWERAVGSGQSDLALELKVEGDNLRAALEWSTSTRDRRAEVMLYQALGWHWYFTGQLATASSTLRAALLVAEDERDMALVLALLARCLAYSEDITGAMFEAESAHELLSSLNTPLTKTWVISTVQLCHFMSVESDPELMLPLAAEAEEIALDSDDVFAEILARQIMADAYCWNGRTEDGLEQQRIALDQAAASGDAMTINQIYGLSIYNYMLDPVARRTEPLRVTEEWMSLVPLDADAWASTVTDWLPWVYMQVGDLDRADKAAAWMGNRNLEGYNRTIYLIARSSLSWMRGNLREARQDVEELEARGVNPRWAHTYYPLAADIATDLGRLDDVREIANTYLAMTVHPTGEAPKLGVLNPLVRAEIDAALDTGSGEHLARAQQALAQMRRILEDHPPRVDSWTSVMTHTQNLAFAEAEITRVTGPSPDRWADAVAKADCAYYQLYARWRLAEARLEAGEGGVTELRDVYVEVTRIAAKLLRTRVEKTARDFNVRLG